MLALESASDALLASRSADGDAVAFGVLIRRHGPYLRAFALRLTRSAADADDSVQDAIIAAWSHLPSLDDPSKFRSWLSSILARKATDRIRSRRLTDELDDEHEEMPERGPEERAIMSSRLDALSEVLDGLPEGQRQCWVLKEMGGYSYEEIAERLGLSVAVVRGKLARARVTIVKEMEVWK